MASAAPDRPDGVHNDVAGKIVRAGDSSFAHRAAAEHPAFLKQSRPGGFLNGFRDSAAVSERLAGGAYDGVHSELGDVAFEGLNDR